MKSLRSRSSRGAHDPRCRRVACAEAPGDPAAVKYEDGKWRDKDGDPTYKIEADGTVDWYDLFGLSPLSLRMSRLPWPGRRGLDLRAGAENSLKTISYAEFYGIVVGGRKNLTDGNDKVMPTFGENKNVMCYLDDIYVYLRARSTKSIGRGRPAKHDDKPPEFDAAQDKCMNE